MIETNKRKPRCETDAFKEKTERKGGTEDVRGEEVGKGKKKE